MCGFIGSASCRGVQVPEIPEQAAYRIRWRGPDRFEECGSPSHRMASARLAIIDLNPEANQPLMSADGQWELVFNGEIYNYKELALSHGLSDKAQRSDTWTLLELIGLFGVDKARRLLRGMYAFAAWETNVGRLWLARDAFGIKPLAWTETNGLILFGSDPRSLASWRGVLGDSCEVDPYALTHYLMVGYIPGDSSAWAAIHKVAPGTCVEIGADGARMHDWDPLQADCGTAPSVEEVEAALIDSVALHLVSDVEVGAFLSGGIDSGLIVALARQYSGAPMRTYSLGFDSSDLHDESVTAARVAEMFGCRHTTVRLSASDFRRLAEEVADAYPEPAADAAAMPTLELSRRARTDVKVVLTGEGGDEMFGGYRRYWALPLARGLLARTATAVGVGRFARSFGGRRIRQMADASGGTLEEAYVRFLTQQQWQPLLLTSQLATSGRAAEALSRYRLEGGTRPTGKSLQKLELQRHLPESYLEKTDRATMRHGLEARVPFLDLRLASVAMRIAQSQLTRLGHTKPLLRQVANRHLPKDITHAPKRGFSVPLEAWLRVDSNAHWVRETLLGGEAIHLGLLDPEGLSRAVPTLGAEAVYRLLALELWARSAKSDLAL